MAHDLPEDPPGLGDALLRWLNTFDDLPQAIETWQDVSDGQILWMILSDIQPDFFAGPLPEPSNSAVDNWIPRWQNLKHIDRTVMTFIRDECQKLPELTKRMQPDLKAIAIDANEVELQLLVKAVLLAAMYSPVSNPRMVTILAQLGSKTAIPIAQCIGNMESYDAQLASELDAQGDIGSDIEALGSPGRALSPVSGGLERDPVLENEEKLYRAYATIKELEEKNTTLVTELEELRGHLSTLEDDLTEARYRLDHGGSDADTEVLEQLRQKSVRDKDYIAELESELNALKASAETQQRQLQQVRDDEGDKQKLRDDMQLLRVERDELVQKAKASENLRKKIQTLQESDKAGVQLREDFDAAQEELQQLRPFKERAIRLQRIYEENMKALSNVEQEIFDQKAGRKRLEHEIKVLSQRLEQARDRQARDADTMAEQEERIRELEAGVGNVSTNPDSLDDEFSSRDKLQGDLSVLGQCYAKAKLIIQNSKSRIQELERENAKLKAGAEDGGDDSGVTSQLHQQMRDRCAKLEKKYLDVYQENLGLDDALRERDNDVLQSQPFIELRDRLHAEEQLRKNKEKRLFDVEAELAELTIKAQAQESKLEAVGKDKAAALELMQQSAGKEVVTAKAENSRLVSHVKTVESELDEQKSLLRHSLLKTHALLREDAGIREKNEFKLVSEELKKFKGDPDSFYEVAAAITQRIEEARTEVAQKDSQYVMAQTQLQAEVEGLQMRLKRAEEEAAKASTTPLQQNMERELKLMSTAWYDVASRMQTDAVVIQRRGDNPRSFLHRQRRLLSQTVIPRKR